MIVRIWHWAELSWEFNKQYFKGCKIIDAYIKAIGFEIITINLT